MKLMIIQHRLSKVCCNGQSLVAMLKSMLTSVTMAFEYLIPKIIMLLSDANGTLVVARADHYPSVCCCGQLMVATVNYKI